MGLKKLLAAAARVARLPIEKEPLSEAEKSAWESYHSSWEMDPPPDPRSVFLAGYRAAQDVRDDVTR